MKNKKMKLEEKNKMEKAVNTLIRLSEFIPEFDVKKNGVKATQEFLEYISEEITIQNLALIEILYPEIMEEKKDEQ